MAGGRVGIVTVSCKSDDEHTLSLYLPRMAKVELRATDNRLLGPEE